MAGSYTLDIELYGVYVTDMPGFEIWEDGVLDSSYSISSSGSTISVTINYGGALPTSLEFRFNDASGEGGRSIEIRSVAINAQHVNVNNYISSDSLINGGNATVDVGSMDYLFEAGDIAFSSAPPAASEFTTGATRTLTAGNDTVRTFSSATDEIFDALAGRDVIYLGSGNDKVNGNAGNDVLRGGAGNDFLFGQADNDRLYGDDGNDTLHGGDGDDRIHGGTGNDEIHGDNGDDRLNGQDGDDVITGGAGADKLTGGNGDDYLFGGYGADQLSGGAGADSIDGGDEDDIIYGGAGIDHLNGGDGDDLVIGDTGDDVIHGDSGDDTLYGRADNDAIYGGANNDYIHGGDGIDTLDGGAGNDVLVGGAGADTIDGGDNDDVIHGHGLTTLQIQTILNANPTVSYNADTNSFYQYVNTGADYATSYAAATGSILNGVAGHLVNITSQAEQDYILANFVTGTESWIGASDADEEDVWIWTDGAEEGLLFWDGGWTGSSVDGVFNSWPPAPNSTGDYTVMYNNGDWDDVSGAAGWVTYLIEWDAGLMNSDNAIDILSGGAGNDHLYGYGGDDELFGGADNDLLIGGAGDDDLDGGNGNDSLYGGDDNDTIDGGYGDDIIYGGVGADVITGGHDSDTIYGGDGNDTLHGENGSDIVYGGDGDDTMTGHNGADVFYGGAGADSINGGQDNDIIYLANGDFAAGERLEGSLGTDEVIFTNATTVDFTVGTLVTLETLTGSSGNDDVTYTIQQALDFTTIDLDGGTDSSRVNIAGTVDVTALGTPTVSNAENGYLTGSTGNDDLTITGAQLDSLIYGGGIIDFDAGTDVLNLTSTSGNLNTLAFDDNGVQNLEEINASTAAAGVNIGMQSQSEDLILVGSANADTLIGGSGADTINAGAGNDIINGFLGADTLSGGSGNDTFFYDNGEFVAGESVDGGADSDQIFFLSATTVDFTTGTLSNLETLTGSGGNDDVTMDLTVVDQFTTVDLAGGTDNMRLSFSGTIDMTAMTAPTISNTENGFMTGSAANDRLLIDGSVDFTDYIYGAGILDFGGGTGNRIDVLGTPTSFNTLALDDSKIVNLRNIYYDAGFDSTVDMSNQTEGFFFRGYGANDTCIGGSGDDSFYNVGGVDTLVGNGGDDEFTIEDSTFTAGASVDGGADNDRLVVRGDNDISIGTITDVEEFRGDNNDQNISMTVQQALSFSSINMLSGTDVVNSLVTGTVDVTSLGTPTVSVNNETGNLTASTGNDDLTISGTQLDALTYGTGIVDFDTGTDVLRLTSTSTNLNTLGATDASILGLEEINFSTAAAAVTLDISGQTEGFILTGSANNDIVDTGSGNDTVNGGAGNDTISAVGGNNTLNGDAGDDTITGGAQSDTLNGGADNDTLNGGNGSDTLNGDAGNDIFDGGSGNDTITGGAGNDTIDGGSGGGDTAVLTGNWADYTITLAGSTYTLVDNVGTDGTDTAIRVENFQFADGTLSSANLIEPVITSNGGGSTASISIAENGTAVTTVTATNPNLGGGALTYSISGGADAALFSIVAGTGVLTFNSAPDYESPADSGANNIYDIEVTASDGVHTDEQNIAVSVTDVAEGDVGSTPGTAGSLNVGESVFYTVDSSGDRDWYAITLTNGVDYAFWARGTPTEAGSSTDPRIYNLYEADGTTSVGGDDDSGIGYESLFTYTATYTGTYYIDAGAWGAVTGSITLSAFVNGTRTVTGGGAQTLTGTANADYLESGGGADTLNGLGGSDILWGEGGNDTLDGGAGSDVLYGATGADTFLFNHTDASDSIVDFTTGDGDVLDISNILVGWNAGTDDIDDYVQFQEVSGDTIMRVDVDGLANGTNFVEVAVLEGNTGEVVQTLYDNGDIIA